MNCPGVAYAVVVLAQEGLDDEIGNPPAPIDLACWISWAVMY